MWCSHLRSCWEGHFCFRMLTWARQMTTLFFRQQPSFFVQDVDLIVIFWRMDTRLSAAEVILAHRLIWTSSIASLLDRNVTSREPGSSSILNYESETYCSPVDGADLQGWTPSSPTLSYLITEAELDFQNVVFLSKNKTMGEVWDMCQ
jgi:hypothetical protein